MTPSLPYLLAVLALVFVIDFALRALPFAALEPLRESAFVQDMGRWLPTGILMVLAVATLRSSALAVPSHAWAALVAAAATVVTHLLSKRKMFLSMLVGTGTYVTLLSLV